MKPCIIVMCLILTGCSTMGGGAGVKWYNPGTWLSGSAGRTGAAITAKLEMTQDKAVTAAQKASHEAQDALAVAGDSRPVDVARKATDNAVTLLDQVAGPISVGDASAIREKVRLLVSDIAAERAKGEALAKDDQKEIGRLSETIGRLSDEKAKSDKNLAAAFERENGLANELRNERWWSWFWRISIGLVALLGIAGYIYLRLTIGGVPTALTKGLNAFRSSDPEAAAKFTDLLDIHTSPAEQTLIRLLSAKHQ